MGRSIYTKNYTKPEKIRGYSGPHGVTHYDAICPYCHKILTFFVQAFAETFHGIAYCERKCKSCQKQVMMRFSFNNSSIAYRKPEVSSDQE